MQRWLSLVLIAGVAGLTAAIHAASQAPQPELPPAATHQVDFATEVAPLFLRSCVRCHARGQSKGRFSIESRERLLAGGRDGAAIVVGNSADSLLVQLVAGLDPDRPMPDKGAKLTAAEIGLVRAWIDQGAAWDDRVTFARQPPRNLTPRRPELPPVQAGLTHPVDRLLAAHPASAAAAAPRADDRLLARRLSLDLIGLLPSPQRADAFAADTGDDKVDRLVASLLDDRAAYATHWLTFWNDLLRNDYRGPGYIDGGRRQISAWLYTALAERMPFDVFVSSLVNPGPDNEGFTKGIVWRGVVNASQTPPMQAAQNVSQVFMGVNLKCASCHDSFINDWQLADAYGLAGVYADAPLEMVECDRPTGKSAPLKFLYPSLGAIDADAERGERVRQLAQLMVDRRNGRLSRTIVNRLWARLFGRGLVEPLDDMDQPAWHPDLLDWLAEDLVAHEFDLTHTLTRIVTSQAYQRQAVSLDLDAAPAPPTAERPFRGPATRRLTAEQFVDGIGMITGIWPSLPAGEFEPAIAGGETAVAPLPADWFWRDDRGQPGAPATASDTSLRFRTTVRLDQPATAATLLVAVPVSTGLDLDGERISTVAPSTRPRVVDLTGRLRVGANVLTLSAAMPAAGTPDAPRPAAIAQLYVREAGRDGALRVVALGASAWESAAGDGAWSAAGVATAPAAKPGDREAVRRALTAAALTGRTRAALTVASPLTTALGRPGREQVVTVRTETPTTLQALELANGDTLSRLLHRGAEALRREPGATPDAVVTRLYERAVSRAPTADERAVALAVLGPSPDVAQIEDLLWAVTMLPDFRLVH